MPWAAPLVPDCPICSPPGPLQVNLDKLVSRASTLVVPNEIATILQREGGVGLNAMTSQDSTRYYVSLPSNKLELWFALESARFQDPVFRYVASKRFNTALFAPPCRTPPHPWT